MANIDKVKEFLESLFPEPVLNDKVWGYSFRSNFSKNIRKIAYATNLTEFTIESAAALNADLLLTHHDVWPFMKARREVCFNLLNKYKLNHCFLHTPLDIAEFGTSFALADALGLNNKKFTLSYRGYLVAVAGDIKNTPLSAFAKLCEKVLGEKVKVCRNNYKNVSRVLVVAGDGTPTESIDGAAAEQCDTYITGEYNLPLQLYAQFNKINLVIGSHTRTEIFGVRSLAKKITGRFPDIELVEIEEPAY